MICNRDECRADDLEKECEELIERNQILLNALDDIDDIVRHHALDTHAFNNHTLGSVIATALRQIQS